MKVSWGTIGSRLALAAAGIAAVVLGSGGFSTDAAASHSGSPDTTQAAAPAPTSGAAADSAKTAAAPDTAKAAATPESAESVAAPGSGKPAEASPSSRAPAKAKTTHFKGVVRDEKLQPVAGAVVTVVSVKPREGDDGEEPDRPGGGARRGRMRLLMGGAAAIEENRTFFTGKTDAAGAYALDAEGDGPFNLRIDATGFAPAFVDDVKGGEATTAVSVQRGVSASGIVGDSAGGTPIADAEVIAVVQPDHGFRDLDDPKRFTSSARSGRNGAFTVPNLLSSFYTFRVVAPGRAAFEEADKPVGDASARPLVFFLSPGFDASGRVVDPAGKPVAKVAITLRPVRRSGAVLRMISTGGFTIPQARTDKDGRFTVRGVPAAGGPYLLEATARDYAPASVDLPLPRAGVVSGIEVRFEKGSTLRAKLVDADQKAVTSGVFVSLTYRDPKTRRLLRTVDRTGKMVQTAPTGEITLDRLPAGLAAVSIRATGFKDVEKTDIQIGREAKGTDLGTLTLDRGKKIVGRVVDGDGKPVAEANVSASSWNAGRGVSGAKAKTDASGRFTLGGLDAADNWTVDATASGYSAASKSDIASDTEGLEIVLPRAGEVKGRLVVGDPPRPVTNFTLEASTKGSGPGANWMMRGRPTTAQQSDPRGAFTVRDLTPGTYVLVARSEGLQDLTREGVDVRAGETTDLGDLTLEAGGTIRGRVQSKPEGLPVPGASVRVKSAAFFDVRAMMGEAQNAVLTDLAGQFELRGLPSGTTTIRVEPEGYARAELAGIKVEPGVPTEDVVVNVGKGGRIEGRVLGEDGRPKAGALVTAIAGIADFSARLSATTDEQGHYAIENAAPGSYRVTNLPFGGDAEEEGAGGNSGPGRRGGFGMDAISAEIKDGETSVVNFGEKKIKVSGTVKRKEGSAASLVVAFLPPGSRGRSGLQMTTTDETGHYEVKLNEPGDYQVYVGDQGMRGGSAVTVSVPDKPEFAYDITLPDGRVTGRITDTGGAAIKGVMVVASPVKGAGAKPAPPGQGTGTGRATSEGDGAYVLKDLPAGSYDLVFTKEGYGSEMREGVEVKGTEETSVDLILDTNLPFKVRVTSPTGSSIPGALVLVSQGGKSLPGVGGMTADDGTMEMKSLKAGTYSFVALTRDFAPGLAANVTIGGDDGAGSAVVALAQGGGARILVQDGGKTPVSGVAITLHSIDSPELDSPLTTFFSMQGRPSATGDDGAVSFERLPAGKYDVTATKGDKTQNRSLTVEDGGKATLTVTME